MELTSARVNKKIYHKFNVHENKVLLPKNYEKHKGVT